MASSTGHKSYVEWGNRIIAVCHDQEPLCWENFDLPWQEVKQFRSQIPPWNRVEFPDILWQQLSKLHLGNLLLGNFHDRGILIHSEQRSKEVTRFSEHFCPVYYWCHGIIARDWFRFAQHDPELTFDHTAYLYDFNIYARAWQGTREYRLKFLDMLVENGLAADCRVTFCPQETTQYYLNHVFRNPLMSMHRPLPFDDHEVSSNFSATYDHQHYQHCAFDCVLETLFDDSRLHLTEKVLRPLACGKPFVLAATHGSLAYLRRYGFKTFAPWIDESYDDIVDPLARLNAIVAEMTRIRNLSPRIKQQVIEQCHNIARYNREVFFSEQFANQLVTELTQGLTLSARQIQKHERNGKFCRVISDHVDLETERRFTDLVGVSPDLVEQIRCELGLGQRKTAQ